MYHERKHDEVDCVSRDMYSNIKDRILVMKLLVALCLPDGFLLHISGQIT